MRLKQLFTIMLLSVLMLACDSPNEPASNGKYEFSSVKYEKCVVYGEGGKVIPESAWNEDIQDYYEFFHADLNMIKGYSFEKEAKRITLYSDLFESIEFEYSMLGDTIIVKGGEYADMFIPWGISVDNNTIELHLNMIGFGITGRVLDQEVMWIASSPDVDEIESDEEIFQIGRASCRGRV